MSLYLDNGYVNAREWFEDPATFIFAIGGRGTGKTFGALEYLTNPENSAGKFVYMRRSQSQIDACKLAELNPFKAVNNDYGRSCLLCPIGKYICGVYHGEVDKNGALVASGSPVGLGIALSVFSNIRGVDGLDYDFILFDEFIKEKHERPIQAEGEAFLNAYETLNRNREMQGRPPIKCILLSNSNDLASPILEAFGLVDFVDKMQRHGRNKGRSGNGTISVYLYGDSPISKAKAETALYKATKSAEFRNMSLQNQFSARNYEYVKTMPIQEYRPFVSVGDVTVYRHVNNGTYYVVDGVKAEERYTTLPIEVKGFRRAFYFVYEAMLDKRVFFASASVKIRFERVWQSG